MKYIFVAGAPGSKWSSVVKNIYYSANIDRSDYSQARTYWHDASGVWDLMHLGAYFDPGMEFGTNFDQLANISVQQAEQEFDRPFNGTGLRIVKSHVFAHHIDYLKTHWPTEPVVLVYRGDDAALGWWVKCGHFDITYPDYSGYYKNLREMSTHIAKQNRCIQQAWSLPGYEPANNQQLCEILGIEPPPQQYQQNYTESDIKVRVI